MITYAVYEGFWDKINKQLNYYKRKCKQLGSILTWDQCGEHYRTVDIRGEKVTLRFIQVMLTDVPEVDDWILVGSVESTELSTHIFNLLGVHINREALPEVNFSGYIIRNKSTLEFKFLDKVEYESIFGEGQSKVANAYVAASEKLLAGEIYQNFGTGVAGSYVSYYSLEELLKMSNVIIKNYGFVPISQPDSSAVVLKHFSDLLDSKNVVDIHSDITPTMVEAYKTFSDSDYLQVIKDFFDKKKAQSNFRSKAFNLLKHECIKRSDFGVAVALVYDYENSKLQKEKRTAKAEQDKIDLKNSQFQGQPGQKIETLIASCKCVRSFKNEYGDYQHEYQFLDPDNNVYMISTTSEYPVDRIVKITATIKFQRESKGVKQNWITRCKIETK